MAEMKTPGQGQTETGAAKPQQNLSGSQGNLGATNVGGPAATSPGGMTGGGMTGGSQGQGGKKAGAKGGPTAEEMKQKTVQAAESVREKTHDLADSARAGIEQVTDKVEKATDYAHKAEEFIRTAEQRLDELITTAEKVLSKGTRYTGVARSWMNDHPEYRVRAQSIISKATEFRDRMSSKLAERSSAMRGQGGESTAEHLRSQGHEAMEKGKETLERGVEKGKEVLERGRERLRGGTSTGTAGGGAFNRVNSFVRNNPTDTLLLGTAIGVILGTAVKHSRDLMSGTDYTGYTGGTGSTYGV